MADQKLQITITADNKEAIEKIQEVAKTLDGVTTSTGKAASGNKGLATEVFKGVASWDMLKQAAKGASDFIMESVQASIAAESKMNLVRAAVESTGASYDQVGPQIEAFGQKMARMGRDDEDAALAAAKLGKMMGGDFTKGMQLAKLASDLTSSGVGTFEDNVDNLSKVLIGKGARALMEYKINLDENATTQEQLDAITKKVTRTTEEFANSTEGKIAVAQEAWSNFKEEIGKGFLTAISGAISENEVMNDSLDRTNEAARLGKVMVYSLTNIVVAAANGFVMLGKGIAAVVDGLIGMFEIIARKKSFSDLKNEMNALADDVESSWKKMKEAMNNALDPVDAIKKQEELDKKLQESAKQRQADQIKVTNANKGAADSYGKIQDAIVKLGDTYKDLQSKGSDALAQLADDQTEKLKTIRDEIKKTEDSVNDLTASFNQQKADDNKSIAEQIVATQQEVADIQKKLAGEVSDEERKQLMEKLQANQQSLLSNADFIKSIDTEVQAAKKRAAESDLQRAIDDYMAKRKMAQQEFDDKMQKLKDQLAAEKLNELSTLALYAEKEIMIKDMMAQATVDYQNTMNNHVRITAESVSKEIDLLNQLASAMSTVRSGSISQLSTVQLNLAGKRASGGSVNSGEAYLIGEQGPEVLVPGQSGTVIPNGKLGAGGTTININISGNTLLDQRAAEKIGDLIVKKLKLNVRL